MITNFRRLIMSTDLFDSNGLPPKYMEAARWFSVTQYVFFRSLAAVHSRVIGALLLHHCGPFWLQYPPMTSTRTFARTVAVRALLTIALTSAATTLTSPARADSASPSAAAKAKAKRSFDRGQELYKEGKLEEATAAFQESYGAVPDPKALLMLARVQRDGGELVKARATCQKARDAAVAAEAKGQANRATLDEIDNELRNIDGVLGLLTIELSHAPPGTRVSIDDNDVTGELGKPIRAEPGPLVVTATTPDGMERRENAMVKAGQASSVTLSFPWSGKSDKAVAAVAVAAAAPPHESKAAPPPKQEVKPSPAQPSNTKRTLTWVAGGVGLVGMATFAVFWPLTASKYDDLESACPQNHCDPSLESDKNTGKTYQTVANVGLVVGAVGLGAAITLFAIPDAAHGNQATRTKLELGLGRVALSGSFQ